MRYISQVSIKTPFKGDWWFWCHFVPNLLPCVRTNNYSNKERFDKVIANINWWSFFCLTVFFEFSGLLLILGTVSTGDWHVLMVSAVVLLPAIVLTRSEVRLCSLAVQVVHPDYTVSWSILMIQQSTFRPINTRRKVNGASRTRNSRQSIINYAELNGYCFFSTFRVSVRVRMSAQKLKKHPSQIDVT